MFYVNVITKVCLREIVQKNQAFDQSPEDLKVLI